MKLKYEPAKIEIEEFKTESIMDVSGTIEDNSLVKHENAYYSFHMLP